jgi:hypothetical protein
MRLSLKKGAHAALSSGAWQEIRVRSVEKHFQEGASTQRSLHCAPPDFLYRLVALAGIMRLSLKKGAHVALSSEAWQEIRVRFGRDDKGEGGAFMESGLGQKAFFITLGGPQAHDSSGRDDKKERAVVKEKAVAKGEGGCWGRKVPSPLTTALSLTPLFP